MQKEMEIAIIGGGAAAFFAAISCKTHHPGLLVTMYEKTDKLLAKVKVSGGGRCNVTHACFSNAQQIQNKNNHIIQKISKLNTLLKSCDGNTLFIHTNTLHCFTIILR